MMFQSLDQLITGSLFILTGQAGAGKSHLAASARRNGTVWILDTEGASKNLLGKPGVHKSIQAVQTLSLVQLTAAMQEIKRLGKPGDTVVLDSVSKVLQAMRAHAQQRAGGDTDRKASIDVDEYASFNRNLQAIYTGLTELKHAGFHVIIIGHLAKQYQDNHEGSRDDVGLRVLADENITYEADAIVLVERNGDQRSMRPIIKPPRPLHLALNQIYAAKLTTLYPELALDEAFGSEPTERPNRPLDANEAERRFFARYGTVVGGSNWNAVQRYLGRRDKKPTTIEGWITAAEWVRQHPSESSAMAA
jgi:predicted ATPase